MVEKLFRNRLPRSDESLLDPGCGTGVFIEGIVRWCQKHDSPLPRIVGIESDPKHFQEAQKSFRHLESVTLVNGDFLTRRDERFDYVIGNPPYVPITGLTDDERGRYRREYRTAIGRFDLYLLFFEQALRLLKPEARLVFITPEKYLYVQSAEPLRRELARVSVEEINLIQEAAFGELTTYPTITTVVNSSPCRGTDIRLRDGQVRSINLRAAASSWLPLINGMDTARPKHTLADACLRISCGVATGADGVYITRTSALTAPLRRFAFMTVSGREIAVGAGMETAHSMLVPYSRSGMLLPEEQLGELGTYLSQPEIRSQLLHRTCALRKSWYAFHENPPLADILRPKILCKDIGSEPYFVVDATGEIVPRHSVYYLVPRDSSRLHELCDYLNSDGSRQWLMSHCQRAANGFVRLQSHVLKRMPLPANLVSTPQLAFA